MNQRTITILVSLFAIAIVAMFAYSYINRENEMEADDGVMENEEDQTPYDSITRIDAKHFYIDGTHSVAGEIMMPTPCDLLEANVSVAESMPEQAMIEFSVINNAETCAQVVTAQRFLVSFDASEDASITARFMGREIELNLVPAGEGETPEDFELYIKG